MNARLFRRLSLLGFSLLFTFACGIAIALPLILGQVSGVAAQSLPSSASLPESLPASRSPASNLLAQQRFRISIEAPPPPPPMVQPGSPSNGSPSNGGFQPSNPQPSNPQPGNPAAPKPATSPKPAKPPEPAFPPLPRQEIRGVWITKNDTEILLDRPKLGEALDQLRDLNFNTIYPVAWNSGYTLFPSAVGDRIGAPYIHRGNQGQDMLADVIAQGHQRGLKVIPWFEFGFMAPPTSEIVMAHPQWLTQRRNGTRESMSAAGEVVWFNPFHPQVQQFVTDLVMEIITKYDGDGIQFDDHTALPSDFGYDAYTIGLYQRETKNAVPSNAKDPDWVKWRANKITAFMTQLQRAIKTYNPKLIISVSPNPYDTAYRGFLQDWLTWARKGIIDELLVQVYRPDLGSFVEQLNRPELREVSQKISAGVGILTGLRRRPVSIQQIQDQAIAAKERNLGVSFFFYESLWEDAPEPKAVRQSGFQWLFRSPAPRA